MNRSVITQRAVSFEGHDVTITRHDRNDFSIYFSDTDCSVRGAAVDIVKEFAIWQWSTLDEPAVSFPYPVDYQDTLDIANPWMDASSRYELTTAEACDTYGSDNVVAFVADVMQLLFT